MLRCISRRSAPCASESRALTVGSQSCQPLCGQTPRLRPCSEMTRPRRCPLLRHRQLARGSSVGSEDALGQQRINEDTPPRTPCPARRTPGPASPRLASINGPGAVANVQLVPAPRPALALRLHVDDAEHPPALRGTRGRRGVRLRIGSADVPGGWTLARPPELRESVRLPCAVTTNDSWLESPPLTLTSSRSAPAGMTSDEGRGVIHST